MKRDKRQGDVESVCHVESFAKATGEDGTLKVYQKQRAVYNQAPQLDDSDIEVGGRLLTIESITSTLENLKKKTLKADQTIKKRQRMEKVAKLAKRNKEKAQHGQNQQ